MVAVCVSRQGVLTSRLPFHLSTVFALAQLFLLVISRYTGLMFPKPGVFNFIGRSGCGKGTQVSLLMDFLKAKDPKRDIVYLQTGKQFREFIVGDTYTQKVSKELYERGGLFPEFLAINMWSNFFVKNMKPDAHVMIDGSPRKIGEAEIFDSAAKFYGWEKPHILFVNVSREWATERLLSRGRAQDDKAESIKSRQDWYDTDVSKVVEFYKNSSICEFHEINGEQSIEDVHKEIVQKTGFLK